LALLAVATRCSFIGTAIPPAIADGRLIYRSRNAVYCVDLRIDPAAESNTSSTKQRSKP
jgi:hypothetical protein